MNFLACLGLVWIVKDSYIFKVPRDYLKSKSSHLSEFLSCSQCLGFWSGVILLILEWNILGFNYKFIFYPLACSAFCWFFDSLLDMIQEVWVFYKNIRESS